jgi:hypothetical protein
MDTLSSLITPPKSDLYEGEELRGHPTLFKTYMLECNSDLYPQFQQDNLHVDISNTGVDEIKILTVNEMKDGISQSAAQFYLDVSDKRFLVLHTNDLAKSTHPFVQKLINSKNYEFDSFWLSTSLLKEISSKTGNKEYGMKADYIDIFRKPMMEDEFVPTDDLQLDISGTILKRVQDLIKKDKEVERAVGYEKIQIIRGGGTRGVLEDLTFDGRFSIIRGKSIDDHMVLVDSVKSDYSKQILEVEKNSIHGTKMDGKSSVEGIAFDFEFDRNVNDWEMYIDRIFDAKEPFRMWGIKSKFDDRFYRVLAVDLHTGHPFDVEISDNLLRVYLPKGSCGNVVLRLFVNLQRYFDSQISCKQLA